MDDIDIIIKYLIYSQEEIEDIKNKNNRILNNPNKKKRDDKLYSAIQLEIVKSRFTE